MEVIIDFDCHRSQKIGEEGLFIPSLELNVGFNTSYLSLPFGFFAIAPGNPSQSVIKTSAYLFWQS